MAGLPGRTPGWVIDPTPASWPGLTRPSTSRLARTNVDARDEPGHDGSPAFWLLPAHHQIVAVDHLGPPADAEDGHHVRGRAALDSLGDLGVVGDQAAADLAGVGAAHDHGIAAGELALDLDHAG